MMKLVSIGSVALASAVQLQGDTNDKIDTITPGTKVLIFGATGGCGKEAFLRLRKLGVHITAVVRDASRLPIDDQAQTDANFGGTKEIDANLTAIVEPNILSMDFDKLVEGKDVVISCLGHNLSFNGICCPPYRLCKNTVQLVCESAERLKQPTRFIIIGTEGVSRVDNTDPKRGCVESCTLGCLWCCLPPHADNMVVMQYVHDRVGDGNSSSLPNEYISFCLVRPSDMVNGKQSEFHVHATLQNGIFNAWQTTRANVGEFIANLVTEQETWDKWKNQYPHILNTNIVGHPDRKWQPGQEMDRGTSGTV